MNAGYHQGQLCKLSTPRGPFADQEAERSQEAWKEGWALGAGDLVGWVGGGEEAPRPVLLWPLVFVLLRTYQPRALLGICSSPYLECSFPRGALPDDFRSTLSVVSSVKPSLTAESWRLPPPCSRGSCLSCVGVLILQPRVLPIRGLGPGSYPLCLLTRCPARGATLSMITADEGLGLFR